MHWLILVRSPIADDRTPFGCRCRDSSRRVLRTCRAAVDFFFFRCGSCCALWFLSINWDKHVYLPPQIEEWLFTCSELGMAQTIAPGRACVFDTAKLPQTTTLVASSKFFTKLPQGEGPSITQCGGITFSIRAIDGTNQMFLQQTAFLRIRILQWSAGDLKLFGGTFSHQTHLQIGSVCETFEKGYSFEAQSLSQRCVIGRS